MAGKGSGKVHEKHQLILANMLREEENKFCADCLAKGPRWASWNIGVFVCIRCAGIHRNLGVHISRVKSVNLDSWTPEQIETIQRRGNALAREKYEANLPANFRRPQDDYSVEQFIRNKYERKLYISKESTVVSKATEAKSSPSSVKVMESKKQSAHQKKDQRLAVPRPQSKRSPTPPAPSTTSTPAPSTTPTPSPLTPSTNLITVETAAPVSKQQTVDLLTGLEASPAPQDVSPQQPSLGEDPSKAVKDTILSLYQTPPTQGYQAYTAHGYPVNPYHYQQQQIAALRMAQQQQQQQMAAAQVRDVEEQMRNLKMRQGASSLFSNGQPPLLQPQHPPTANISAIPPTGGGGQTLNPHLW